MFWENTSITYTHWFLSFQCTWAPELTSPQTQSGPAVRMDEHMTFVLRKPFAHIPLPVHGTSCLYVAPWHPPHVLGGVLISFYCWHHKQFIIESFFFCITFKNMPLNSKPHEGREHSVLFTTVYPAQHCSWHTGGGGVGKCVVWLAD